MKKPLRILLVEDRENDALLLVNELKRGGYDPVLERVDSRAGVKAALAGREWDCVISDYSMPQFSGLEALAELQSSGRDIPFILVSGTIGEELAVEAMKLGAHDYIMKDNLSRLVPAIERELREAEAHREQKRTHEALSAIEERFRKAFEFSPMGMALVALDGHLLQVSPSLCRILGYTEQELVGMSFGNITHPDDLEEYRKSIHKLVSGDIQAFQMEKRYVHKLGHSIWGQLSVALVRDAQDRPSYFISQIQDITEHKESGRQIRLLAEALSSTRDCFVLTDLNENILFVNPAVSETYGYTAEELIGKSTSILHSSRVSREILAEISRHTALNGWKGELLDRRKNGSDFPIELWTSVVRDEAGSPVALVGVARDISDRKQAEQHLRESEEEFRLISENVADMIAVLGVDGKRLYNSPSYKEILGDPDALRGTDAFFEIHPDDREKIKQVFEETVRTGIGQRTEYRFLLNDGTIRHIESQGSVIKNEDGTVSKVVVVSRDVTEKKRLELQFLRAQRMESIGTLASGIAHDLNNVLAPIMMAIELIRTKVSDTDGKKLLDTVESSAKRGSAIVKQVLAFGRGIKGEQINLQLKHVISEVVKIVEETFPKSIEIRTDTPGNLWTVMADPTQMHQVLLNVCVNARDAMSHGGTLTLSAENVTLDDQYARMNLDARPGSFVVVAIADTGTGIPEALKDKIFDPFFTTKEVGKGTGLGLSTTLGIVRSHKGFIHVYSEVGKGTTIKIYLPASGAGVGAKTHDRPASLPMGKGELILIIDDEAAIREITSETLQASGYRAMTASDGAEGIALYAGHKREIKVVITDIMMPIMDGTAVIRALQTLNPGVKIIAVSGMAANGRSAGTPEGGVRAFLTKPYTAEKLLVTLSRILGVR